MGLWRGQLLASHLLLCSLDPDLHSVRLTHNSQGGQGGGAEDELDPRKLQGCCGAALAWGTAQGACGEGRLQQALSAPGFIWV